MTGQDPHLVAVGFDVTAMSKEEMAAAGIVIAAPVLASGRPPAWVSHSYYSELNPDHEQMARSYARLAAYLHLERQALQVQCPRCLRGEKRPCNLGAVTRSAGRPQLGYTHKARRDLARKEGLMTLRGLSLQRTFPCIGMFREIETRMKKLPDGRTLFGPKLVQCDTCGEQLGVGLPKPGEEPEPEQPELGGTF